MAYTLNYGKNSTKSLTVQDGQSGTVANLTFPGRNFSGYGSPVDQNFMLLAENFASANGANGPQYAIQGQLWYDTRGNSASTLPAEIISTSWSGLKVKNNDDSTAPSWSQIVTFDTAYDATTGSAINPKHLTGLGNVGGSNLSISRNSVLSGNVTIGTTSTNTLIINATTTFNTDTQFPNITVGNLTASGNVTANILKTGTTTLYSNGGFLIGNSAAKVTVNGALSGITGRGITWTPGLDEVTIMGNVRVTGKLQATDSSGTSTTTLNISDQFINLAKQTGTYTIVNNDSGLLLYRYSSTTNQIPSFIGKLGGSSVSAPSGGTIPADSFVIASNVTPTLTGSNPTSISAINALANLYVNSVDVTLGGAGTGTITATTLIGKLQSSSGSTTNVTPSSANITVNGAETTSSTTTTGTLRVVGTDAGAYIQGNLRVAGNIFGRVQMITTSADPANLQYIKSDQANIANANITTLVGTTATFSGTLTAATGNFTNINVTNTTKTNVLLCNTTATVNSLTANTTVTATTGLTVSGTAALTTRTITTGAASTGGTITGAWTLTTGSTLEATYSADLAERHHADANYPTGTVMTVGGSEEITGAQNGDAVLGVVSDAWAYLMNGGAGPQETHPAVAYCGRVPVRIVGPVKKHERVSPLKDGVAVASMANPFGWAIESNDDPGEKLVLCIIK